MTELVVYKGSNILQSHQEVLIPVSLKEICATIREDAVLQDEVMRLRKIAKVDQKAYARVKTRLPYFCCASFEEGIRNGANFKSISALIMDLDKFPGPEALQEARRQLIDDPRVKCLYISPGGLGLKIIFELTRALDSLKTFSDFYRIFTWQFAEQYHLQQCLDKSTLDATRVSFLSFDPDVHYNVLNHRIDPDEFLPAEITQPQTSLELTQDPSPVPLDKQTIQEEVYKRIYQVLHPDRKQALQRKKDVYVPDILRNLDEPLQEEALRLGLVVRSITDIQYGRKVVFGMGQAWGEVNVFYGKRGYSVVRTPKTGSDPRLAELGEMIIWRVLALARIPQEMIINSIIHQN